MFSNRNQTQVHDLISRFVGLGPALMELLERRCQLVEKKAEKRQNHLIRQMTALVDQQSQRLGVSFYFFDV